MRSIRKAKKEEANCLSEIAFKSEAYWGYDENYMKSFRSNYRVTEEFISNNPAYIIEDNEIILGFYSFMINGRTASLDYFYIEPNSIGHGYGKLLWNHMINMCKKKGIEKVELVTSPQAEEFYIKMGARTVGQVESIVMKGRKIPKLIFDII